jgi:Protein of unknown function (DUF3467)
MAANANPRRPRGGGNGGKRTEINLRMPEQIAGGVYANGMMVQHTADEFVLDFAMVMAGTGTVVSRVVTSPGHAKRIAEALQENIAKYEAAHGPIRRSGGPPGLQMGPRPPVDDDE